MRPGWSVGAVPEQLPDPSQPWTWQAQQAYAVRTAERVASLESSVERVESAGVLVALATGVVGGLLAAAGYQLWRSGRGR